MLFSFFLLELYFLDQLFSFVSLMAYSIYLLQFTYSIYLLHSSTMKIKNKFNTGKKPLPFLKL